MIKLGPVASWTFAFRGSGWFARTDGLRQRRLVD